MRAKISWQGRIARNEGSESQRNKNVNETSSIIPNARPGEETWSVVVLYEDTPTRDRAMLLCNRLVKNFWSDVEFDFHWWRTDFLDDPRMARIAAADATATDIFIFSSSQESGLSPAFLKWFEDWSREREARDGLLLDLSDAPAQTSRIVQQKQARLRKIAELAHLDYCNRLPPRFSGAMLNSRQNVEARAHEVSSVLEDILHRLPPPSHYGLNE
jgi:hypothetical protein